MQWSGVIGNGTNVSNGTSDYTVFIMLCAFIVIVGIIWLLRKRRNK